MSEELHQINLVETNLLIKDKNKSPTLKNRESRFTPPVKSPLHVEILGITNIVINYSSSGLLVKGDSSYLELGDRVFSMFILLPSEIREEHLVRIVRREPSENDKWSIAFEVIGGSLDVSLINAVVEIESELKEQANKSDKYSNIPDRFRHLVLDAKVKIENTKSMLDRIEVTIPNEIKKNVDKYELLVAKIVSRHFLKHFTPMFTAFSDLMGDMAIDLKQVSAEYFREMLGEYIYLAPFPKRAFTKPLGYSGDYEMMNHIYRNEVVGSTLFFKCLNYYFLNHPYSQAVRNRAVYLKEKIVDWLENHQNESEVRILSVACGPIRELCSLLSSENVNSDKLVFYLLDQDEGALAEAKRQLQLLELKTGKTIKCHFINENVVSFVRRSNDIKFHLIYSAGLFDYFSDSLARLVASRLYRLMLPSGELIIGNYCKFPAGQMQMELILDWHLNYRTRDELLILYGAVSKCVKVEEESNGVNLFAIIKSDTSSKEIPYIDLGKVGVSYLTVN